VNRLQLFDTFRARAFDTERPYLWSDDELQEFLDDAHNEAAERGLLLRDATTAEICEVAISAGTAAYPLDPRILVVIRAKLDSQTRPLEVTSTPALDRCDPGWESRSGSVNAIAIDAEGAGWTATLVGPPTAAGTLRLHVFRLPLESIDGDTDEPEINPRLHVRLVDWMMARAYAKKDAETQDDAKAAQHEAIFTSAFGQRVDANARRKQYDRAPTTTTFREF
jgi:hypothetical protein